jgi:hypothetical protein
MEDVEGGGDTVVTVIEEVVSGKTIPTIETQRDPRILFGGFSTLRDFASPRQEVLVTLVEPVNSSVSSRVEEAALSLLDLSSGINR